MKRCSVNAGLDPAPVAEGVMRAAARDRSDLEKPDAWVMPSTPTDRRGTPYADILDYAGANRRILAAIDRQSPELANLLSVIATGSQGTSEALRQNEGLSLKLSPDFDRSVRKKSNFGRLDPAEAGGHQQGGRGRNAIRQTRGRCRAAAGCRISGSEAGIREITAHKVYDRDRIACRRSLDRLGYRG